MKKIYVCILVFAVFSAMIPYAFASADNPFQDANVGDTVLFGRYEQNDNFNDGTEDISWLVLERDKGKMLVISEFALDCQPYNTQYDKLTWEKCSLRRWLNDSFLNTAFTATEQTLIMPVEMNADANPEYHTDAGRSTEDFIFLLSAKESSHYFNSEYERFCRPTSYAVAQGGKVNEAANTCWWWTRTPGCDNYYVVDVRGDGTINYTGGAADRDYLCVRPALWINLSASAETGAETMPTWKQAYYNLIMETPRIEEWNHATDVNGKLLLCAYSLYDIDKDGIPELFLHFGDGEAVEYGRLYTYRDDGVILLTLSRSREIAGSGDGRWEESFFPYGWNYFSTYPEENGVLFAHDHSGQYFTVWSIEGEYIMESDIILSQEYPEITAASVVFPSSCVLTEFPAYTILPLMMYEKWAQQVEATVEESKTDPAQELRFPENDPNYFESIISGDRPVIPCLIPRRYDSWKREYYSYAMKQAATQNFRDIENYLSVYETFRYLPSDYNETPLPWPVPEKRSILYVDFNGDRKAEAICFTIYKGLRLLFIISEQDGKAYVYGMTDKNVRYISVDGDMYFCYPDKYAPSTLNVLHEGAFKVFFDEEECFFVNLPLEGYKEIKCQLEEFATVDGDKTLVCWSDPY